LKFISVPIKKKAFQFQFVNQQCLRSYMQGIKCREHKILLLSPLKMTFHIFCIHLKPLKNQKFDIDKPFY
jgi:hypothetical protein